MQFTDIYADDAAGRMADAKVVIDDEAFIIRTAARNADLRSITNHRSNFFAEGAPTYSDLPSSKMAPADYPTNEVFQKYLNLARRVHRAFELMDTPEPGSALEQLRNNVLAHFPV